MNHHYDDIRSRIAEEPRWWDEHGTPRYCEFSPEATANIYVHEAVLLGIECQGCRRKFKVCLTASDFAWGPDGLEATNRPLRRGAEDRDLHYGDPPNTDCCAAGPTMNSVPIRILEFWERDRGDWKRVPELERDIDCDWDG